MFNAEIIEGIQNKYASFSPYLNERTRRIWAGIEAKALGYGGVSAVSHATGLNRNTIAEGIKELETEKDEILEKGSIKQIRKTGGGRKHVETIDSTLIKDLEALVEPTTRGDPESPLRWTCKSTSKLAEELQKMGHQVCSKTVYNLLRSMDYSLQSNRKTEEGKAHPDRDAQFKHIAKTVSEFQQKHRPVIKVLS